jgi:hypothetical protein
MFARIEFCKPEVYQADLLRRRIARGCAEIASPFLANHCLPSDVTIQRFPDHMRYNKSNHGDDAANRCRVQP